MPAIVHYWAVLQQVRIIVDLCMVEGIVHLDIPVGWHV